MCGLNMLRTWPEYGLNMPWQDANLKLYIDEAFGGPARLKKVRGRVGVRVRVAVRVSFSGSAKSYEFEL